MSKYKYVTLVILVVGLILTLSFCSTNSGVDTSGVWLIPEGEIQDGGPGKDGIAALVSPNYIPGPNVDFLIPTDLVIGLRIGDFVVAFPHPIMDHHEIVNDIMENLRIILSYCPLTGSAMAWQGDDNAGDYTFGVSGLLYNANLILYDRATDSNWSQMLMLCVNGSRIRQDANILHVIETTWETWQQLYPNAPVLSTDTGFSRDYRIYPYGGYKTSDSLIFSVDNEDSRLHKKERVHGVIVSEDQTKAYVIRTFSGGGAAGTGAAGVANTTDIKVLNDSFAGVDLVVVGSSEKNFIASFSKGSNDPETFTAVQSQLPIVMTDNEGNMWDIFGYAVSGPRAGERLTPTTSFNAYWFAWGAFYPGAEIYQ
jgi:hypothetical protein